MRPADRGTRGRRPVPAAFLVAAALVVPVSGLVAGCSSPPAYCTDATNLKNSVQYLGSVDVAKNGLDSLQTALSSVQSDAKAFVTDAKSAFPSQAAALNAAVSGLRTAIASASGQPPLTAAATVASSVAQVTTAATDVQDAVSGNCT